MKSIKFTLLALAIAGSSAVMAQTDGRQTQERAREHRFPNAEVSDEKRDEIQRRKVAFIATELKLTPEEAEKFWPVYNAYEAERAQFRDEAHDQWKEKRSSAEKPEAMSPEKMDRMMNAKFAGERKRIEVEENYYKRFKAILPPEKVVGLYEAEREFKREIMRSMRERGPAPRSTEQRPARRSIEGERVAPQREEVRPDSRQ